MTDADLAAQLLVTFGGLFLLGLLADLAGRIRPGEPTQAEALGFVLLAAGLAAWLHVSLILSAMVLGATVVFELVGPVITRWTLVHVGDIRAASGSREVGRR